MINYNKFLKESENMTSKIIKKDFNNIREEYVDFWETLRQKIEIIKKYNLRDENEVEKYNNTMRSTSNPVSKSSVKQVVKPSNKNNTKIIDINRKKTYANNDKDKKAVDDLIGKVVFKDAEVEPKKVEPGIVENKNNQMIKKYIKFLEDLNPNSSQKYLDSLKQDKPKNDKDGVDTPTDGVDKVLQDTEKQKDTIIKQKDAIEKGLLNNIQNMEAENQEDVKTQVDDYKDQVGEFDKTVKQIDKLKQSLEKSDKTPNSPTMKTAKQKNI